ncbi:MAG: FHA domain-containing protein [Halobacteriales archaeon]|nr:FHA domain-containing protein [Halobacteriales archaeon]
MEPVDTARLAEVLKALGNANRLELLYELRVPRAVGDIELRPEKVREGEDPERAISQQAVRDHLAKLRAIGVIAVQRAEHEAGIVDAYVLNHQRLFAIVEELRRLGELRGDTPGLAEPTLAGHAAEGGGLETGPRFVLVRGQGEGRVFSLRKEQLRADRGWIIGRKPGLAVSLDYDPFASAENAEVLLDGSGFSLLDIRSSKNGTRLNFRPLPRGGSAGLQNGDVVGVGRTNLVFRLG